MSKLRWSVLTICVLIVAPCAYSQDAADPNAGLRSLAEQYYARWAAGEQAAFVGLWSKTSPFRDGRKRKLEQDIANGISAVLSGVSVQGVQISGDKATVKMQVGLNGTDKAGKTVGPGLIARTLEFVREADGWKLWNETTEVDDLASALLDAATDEDRAAVLKRDERLITPDLTHSLQEIGNRLRDGGSHARAIAAFTLAEQMAERMGDERRLARALNSTGVVYGMQASYAKCLEYLQRSLRLYAKLGDENSTQDLLINVGNVFRWQRDFDQALAAQRRVLSVAEGRNDKRRAAIATINIAFILQEQDDLDGALKGFAKAGAAFSALDDKRNAAYALSSGAAILSTRGEHEAALKAWQQALENQKQLNDKPGQAYTLAWMAFQEQSRGEHQRAIELARLSTDLATELQVRETLWRAQTTLGRAHLGLRNHKESREAFQQAIDTIEGMRQDLVGSEREQQRFFTDKLHPYWAMTELLIGAGKPADALVYAERAKARMLLDVARSGRTRVTQAMTAAEREQEERLRRELAQAALGLQKLSPQSPHIAKLRDRRDGARLEYEKFQTALYAAHPELKVKRGEAEWGGLESAAGLLTNDMVIVEFVVTPARTHGFVMTKSTKGEPGLRSWTVDVTSAELAKRTEQLRRQLADRDLGFRRAARDMFELLLKPAASELAGKSTLVIVPDGALWELPFQALDRGGRYLLEDHAVLYAPSLAVLAALRSSPVSAPGDNRVLAIGNPAPGTRAAGNAAGERSTSGDLPFAKVEVETLSRIYGRKNSTALTGAEAIESAVKSRLRDYSVLHFATHGVRDNRDPMRSHLVLAKQEKSDTDDGLLEAWELMQMDLKANLVVLSACDTARGSVGAGEGMIGLTWALFIAGAPTMVASQWAVDSQSTTDLMIGFYRRLASGPGSTSSLEKARALRSSALRLLRGGSYAHPFYWAGFVVVGARL